MTATASEGFAIGRKCHSTNIMAMSVEGRLMLCGASIPQPYCLINASTGECLAIWGERYGKHPIRMPCEQGDFGFRVHIVEPNADGTCRGKLSAVRRMCYIKNSPLTEAYFGIFG